MRPAIRLAPCPFCGSEPILMANTRGEVIIECINLAHPHIAKIRSVDSVAEAIAHWNQRPPLVGRASEFRDAIALDVARAIKDLDPIAMPGGHAQYLAAIQRLVRDAIIAALPEEPSE